MNESGGTIVPGDRIFITGGTGFLGAYIIRELVAKGYRVKAMRRRNSLPHFIEPAIFEKVDWIRADLFDLPALYEAMDEVDAVIHSAAKISFLPKEKKEMFKTNIEGTANIVNTAIDKEIKKLVYVSSVAALGRTKNAGMVNEGNPWDEINPHSNYASSKYHAEMEVWRAMGEGLNAAIVNPSTIIGYGDWNTGSCAIFKTVHDEFPWYTTGANGFVDVADVARAVVLLMESDIRGERFLVSGENSSFRDLFNRIADGFSKKHPSLKATPFLAAVAWRIEKLKSLVSGKPSILTRETAQVAQSKVYFDHTKILNRFPGFQFTPLEETINKSCAAYLQYTERE
jgi:nucleoside-diphosphate-sugar epimerase